VVSGVQVLQHLSSALILTWLKKRGLDHPELVSHFRQGFAGPHGVAGVLLSPNAKEGRALRSRLTELGVLRDTTCQDHFRGCLVVPVVGWSESVDPASRGRVLQLYGRRTMPDHQIKRDRPGICICRHRWPGSGIWPLPHIPVLRGTRPSWTTQAPPPLQPKR
jgi:hypothetical protein